MNTFRTMIWVCLIVLSLMSVPAHAISVDAAYQAIPHRQTTFDPENAEISKTDKTYLKKQFYLVDLAMAYRVAALQNVNSNGRDGVDLETYRNQIKSIMSQMKAITPPKRLQNYHNLVYNAVYYQREYFKHLQDGNRFSANHPYVQKAHQKLYQAYQILMEVYPEATSHNKQAFFDHLCALDFI